MNNLILSIIGERKDYKNWKAKVNDCSRISVGFVYDNINSKGEKIIVNLTAVDYTGKCGKKTMRAWVKAGKLKASMPYAWGVDTEVLAVKNGMENSYRGYNPTIMPGGNGWTINFEWYLEATEENLYKLLDEIERQFLEES